MNANSTMVNAKTANVSIQMVVSDVIVKRDTRNPQTLMFAWVSPLEYQLSFVKRFFLLLQHSAFPGHLQFIILIKPILSF